MKVKILESELKSTHTKLCDISNQIAIIRDRHTSISFECTLIRNYLQQMCEDIQKEINANNKKPGDITPG
jgi:hypothetical protein